MTEEKRKVIVELKRELTYKFEAQLTEEQYKQLEDECSLDCSGADIAWVMGKDISDEPDDWRDDAEIVWSDWEKEKQKSEKKVIE